MMLWRIIINVGAFLGFKNCQEMCEAQQFIDRIAKMTDTQFQWSLAQLGDDEKVIQWAKDVRKFTENRRKGWLSRKIAG